MESEGSTRIRQVSNKRRASLDGYASLKRSTFVAKIFFKTHREEKHREIQMPERTPIARHFGLDGFNFPHVPTYFDGNSLIALGKIIMSSSDTQPRLKDFAA